MALQTGNFVAKQLFINEIQIHKYSFISLRSVVKKMEKRRLRTD